MSNSDISICRKAERLLHTRLGEESPGVRVTPARFPSKLRFASSFVIVLFQQAGREVVFAIQYSSASSLNH
ncbi:hypothetical protein T4B_3634 [Trichinella pseudospiralis]|uniref:Uncharacterized protein n=2 Tax=Trichinella pseudospiralis TaxID=6337 RepID=A0A0V1FAW8_TRIPS|nr:hypothetical protein T4D_11980 [Trichinella pseudospiralis]KRZ24003.1 hypothetical protein T4B_3634 [Trichinella pseudospiralis]